MNSPNKLFTKVDCEVIHAVLNGNAPATKGVPVSRFLGKIQAVLRAKGIERETKTINQTMFWKSNNQDIWQAAYEVIERERPGLYDLTLNEIDGVTV